MNESILDPECNGETFHTRDFLFFSKINNQYHDDLKTDKISTLNYTKEFFKKYLMGNELFNKMDRINKIIDKRINNECNQILISDHDININDYKFSIDYLDADILNDMSDCTIIPDKNEEIRNDISIDLFSNYPSNIPTKLDIEYNNVGLRASFKYHLVDDAYTNHLYSLVGLSVAKYIDIMFSHYHSHNSNRDYQYLYISCSDRNDDSNLSGIILYYNTNSDEIQLVDRTSIKIEILSQYSNIIDHIMYNGNSLDNFKFVKCNEPIFDDYSLPLIRFYRWARCKQFEMSHCYNQFPGVLASYKLLFDKWCKLKNIIKDKESEKEFLGRFFIYDPDFIKRYNGQVVEQELSTQWYTQIFFSIIIHVLGKSIPDFISARDCICSKKETMFSKINEVMITDFLIDKIKENCKQK